MRDLLHSLDLLDIGNVLDRGGETSVHTEDRVVNDGSDGQIVEEVGEELPHSEAVVLPLAFGVETVDLGDLPCFVVASQKSDALWEPQFQQHQVGNRLYAERPCSLITLEAYPCRRSLPGRDSSCWGSHHPLGRAQSDRGTVHAHRRRQSQGSSLV